MFYAHFVLSKKGPLARVWLAAHWDKKLTKANIFETDIEGSVQTIMSPKTKLALRTSGHLLLGIVRIYSRKAKYLLADCNDAFVRIRLAFRPGQIDLPADQLEVPVELITLRTKFHDFESVLANDFSERDFNSSMYTAAFQQENQCRPEEITLREELLPNTSTVMGLDDFDDMDCGSPWSEEEAVSFLSSEWSFASLVKMSLGHGVNKPSTPIFSPPLAVYTSSNLLTPMRTSLRLSQADSGIGSSVAGWDDDDSDYCNQLSPGVCSSTGSTGRVSVRKVLQFDTTSVCQQLPSIDEASLHAAGDFGVDIGVTALCNPSTDEVTFSVTNIAQAQLSKSSDIVESVAAVSAVSAEKQAVYEEQQEILEESTVAKVGNLFDESSLLAARANEINQQVGPSSGVADASVNQPDCDPARNNPRDETTIIEDVAMEFALEPVTDNAALESGGQGGKSRRRRRLIVDDVKLIPSEVVKKHLAHTDDIMRVLELAPPTKRLMLWKEESSVEQLLHCPGKKLTNQRLLNLFAGNLITKQNLESDEETGVRPSRKTVTPLSELKRIDTQTGSRSVLSVSNVTEQPTPGVDASLVSAANDTFLTSESTSRIARGRKRAISQPDELEALPVLDVDISVMDINTSVLNDNALVVNANPSVIEGHTSAVDVDVTPTCFPTMAREKQMEMLPFVEAEENENEPLPSIALSESNSGQQLMDELNANEQEEQRCKLRTTQMHHAIERVFRRSGDINKDSKTLFSKVAPPSRTGRKQAAAQFCALLALKKLTVVDIEQEAPFSDIIIRRGPKFNSSLS